jgi:hypothetical protein
VIDDLLDRLDKVRQTGEHKYLACCPVHGDRNPSMSLSEVIGDDGNRKVLVYCFACHAGAQEVVEALGLSMSVLFEKPLDRGPNVWDEFDRQFMPLSRGASPLDRGAPSTGRGGSGTGRGGVPLDRGRVSSPLDRGGSSNPLDRGGSSNPLDRGGVPLTRKQREEAELDRLVIAGAEEAERSGKPLSYRDYKRVKLARSRLEAFGLRDELRDPVCAPI